MEGESAVLEKTLVTDKWDSVEVCVCGACACVSVCVLLLQCVSIDHQKQLYFLKEDLSNGNVYIYSYALKKYAQTKGNIFKRMHIAQHLSYSHISTTTIYTKV